MKTLLTLLVLCCACFAQDLRDGYLHRCSSDKPLGLDEVLKCHLSQEEKDFYHLVSRDGDKYREYVFEKKAIDDAAERIFYDVENGSITVYVRAGRLNKNSPHEKLFTRRVLAYQILK
jgi:hypothetical protein